MKKLKFLFSVIVFLGFAFAGWDWYMRSSWDDHIVSSQPHSYRTLTLAEDVPDAVFIRKAVWNSSGRRLTDKEVADLPDVYKRPLDIVQKGNRYIWRNNENMAFKRTTIDRGARWLIFAYGDNSVKWTVFSNKEDTVKILIRSNQYLSALGASGTIYTCTRGFWSENVIVSFKKSEDIWISYSADTQFYQHYGQHTRCNVYGFYKEIR